MAEERDPTTPESAPVDASAAEAADPGAPPPDPWEPFDSVLPSFASERSVAVGTWWADEDAAETGRFVAWENAVGWRCRLRLLRVPRENVIALVAEGPPFPDERARAMMLAVFPPEVEVPQIRGWLELGFSIGETWGPAAEPAPAPPADPPPGSDDPADPGDREGNASPSA